MGKPYTDFFPKAMIPINGKPLIHYIINYIGSFKFIDEILIVSDFKGLGGQIQNYLENIAFRKKVTFVQDSQSGTAGDLVHVSKKLEKTSEILLWFVDNLCAIDLKKLSKNDKISSFDVGKKYWFDIESPVIVERNESFVKQIIKEMGS